MSYYILSPTAFKDLDQGGYLSKRETRLLGTQARNLFRVGFIFSQKHSKCPLFITPWARRTNESTAKGKRWMLKRPG